MSKERESQIGSLLLRYKPRRCVEVGVETGAGTLFMAGIVKDWGGHVLAVDCWDNGEMFKTFIANLADSQLQGYVSFMRSPSVAAARAYVPYADFVYVDADHSFESVLADLKAWYPHVRPSGGVLAGDDYAMEGVHAAWNEFADREGLQLDKENQVVWTVRSQ